MGTVAEALLLLRCELRVAPPPAGTQLPRALHAQAFVFCDRRPLRRVAKFLRPHYCVAQIVAGSVVHFNKSCDIIRVITDTGLTHRLPKLFFNKHSIGDDLNAITMPSERFVVLPTPARPFLCS